MKKLAKKLVALLCTLAFAVSGTVGLSSCSSGTARHGFFRPLVLRKLELEDMPKPDFEYLGSESIFRELYGNIEKSAFDAYAQQLFDYLTVRYAAVGLPGCPMQENGWDIPYKYIPCEQVLDNYVMETEETVEYYFVCFDETPTEGSVTSEIVTLHYLYEPAAWNQDIGAYNFRMTLKKSGVATRYVYTSEEFPSYTTEYMREGLHSETYPKVDIIDSEAAAQAYFTENGWEDIWLNSEWYEYGSMFFFVFEKPSAFEFYVCNGVYKTEDGRYQFNFSSCQINVSVQGESLAIVKFDYELDVDGIEDILIVLDGEPVTDVGAGTV